ncbi:MAG: hypothetical protein Q4A03_10985 [Rothia sp. (in: high G+C Gram-positive bacteria)]|uniref:hypothetical protein n=1 Tax=Rothia sp. (in: high G+C Gram-positive bacteria) TaxID=1885016 RepID=UPI002708EF8E|nr:hypothetical protein [Rothia sp. (in: high G+C Gram-positive bacteria)]
MSKLTSTLKLLLVALITLAMFLSSFTAGNASTTVRELEGNRITTTSTSTGSIITVIADGQTTQVIENVVTDKITIIDPDGTTGTVRLTVQGWISGLRIFTSACSIRLIVLEIVD